MASHALDVLRILDIIDIVDDKEEERLRVPAPLRDRSNPFFQIDDNVFKHKFRFSKRTVMCIVERLNLRKRDNRGLPIPVHVQILVALRFFVTGTLYGVIKDLGMNIEQSTACRSLHAVARALAAQKHEAICFPQNLSEVKEGFSELSENNFIDAIGAIDGALLKVRNPGGPNRKEFFCKNQYYAVNCQFVCDANMRILNVVAKWPGTTSDNQIFQNSSVYHRLENGLISGYLLGDHAYACRPYLITPVPIATSYAEITYNEVHYKTWNVVQRMLSAMKRRLPCLRNELKVKIENALTAIIAAAVLHNWALEFKDDTEFDETYDEEEDEEEEDSSELYEHMDEDPTTRIEIIHDMFQ